MVKLRPRDGRPSQHPPLVSAPWLHSVLQTIGNAVVFKSHLRSEGTLSVKTQFGGFRVIDLALGVNGWSGIVDSGSCGVVSWQVTRWYLNRSCSSSRTQTLRGRITPSPYDLRRTLTHSIWGGEDLSLRTAQSTPFLIYSAHFTGLSFMWIYARYDDFSPPPPLRQVTGWRAGRRWPPRGSGTRWSLTPVAQAAGRTSTSGLRTRATGRTCSTSSQCGTTVASRWSRWSPPVSAQSQGTLTQGTGVKSIIITAV